MQITVLLDRVLEQVPKTDPADQQPRSDWLDGSVDKQIRPTGVSPCAGEIQPAPSAQTHTIGARARRSLAFLGRESLHTRLGLAAITPLRIPCMDNRITVERLFGTLSATIRHFPRQAH